MRFLAENGHIDLATLETAKLVVSVTEEMVAGRGVESDVDLAVVSMTPAHGRALAAGIWAACDELEARAVSL